MSGKFGKFGKSSTFGKAAAVAAAATAVVTLAGTPAGAAADAYNTRSVWVDGVPMDSDAPACTTRSIYLASGTYTWRQTLDGIQWPTRDLYLASGTYTWTDCLTPRSGGAGGNGYYKQSSSLSKPGSETAYLVDPHEQRLEQGTYVFGSVLDPHF
ncbi:MULTISPECIES: hypothetical protein [Streptomyces]|uniref:hypothetical protein n=1 Tax=Streptomyces TaxID=1883 RepID=UPI000F6DCA50|nr:hypothetical protein [Streptomyces sp. W1SF4]AZM90430.1 hypothetical protein D1J60_19880 [Streptomyces sp. W1SF4]